MKKKSLNLAVILAALTATACTEPGGTRLKQGQTPSGAVLENPALETQAFTASFASVGREYLLLSNKQLQNKINQCLGEDLDKIDAKSIINASKPSSDAFLLSDKYKEGTSIFDYTPESIDGPASLTATEVRSSKVSLAYLNAQQIIANVVANNCNKELESPKRCVCNTKTTAKNLLTSCLPNIASNTDQFNSLAESFEQLCTDDSRAAIASLVASFAFALSP